MLPDDLEATRPEDEAMLSGTAVSAAAPDMALKASRREMGFFITIRGLVDGSRKIVNGWRPGDYHGLRTCAAGSD